MNTQILRANPRAADANHYQADATSVSIFERIKRFFTVTPVQTERKGDARERSLRSLYSRDILRSLPLDEKQRLGLHQWMD